MVSALLHLLLASLMMSCLTFGEGARNVGDSKSVVSREVYHVDYHLTEGIIHPAVTLESMVQNIRNPSSDPVHVDISFSYTAYEKFSWNSTKPWSSIGNKSHVKLNARVPTLSISPAGEVIVVGGKEKEFTWGEPQEFKEETEKSAAVSVPPNTSTKVTLAVSRHAIEIPFSYMRLDIYSDGSTFSFSSYDDGYYTGVSDSVTFAFENSPIHGPKPVMDTEVSPQIF